MALILLASCLSEEEKRSRDLVGEWRNTYLKVVMPSFSGSDSTRITECDSANWEKMLGIKPIRTTFRPDGTYQSNYYNLNDSLFRSSSGTWSFKGDTLILTEGKNKTEYRLKSVMTGSEASFEGMMDFDGDGDEDDHYLGRQRKQIQ